MTYSPHSLSTTRPHPRRHIVEVEQLVKYTLHIIVATSSKIYNSESKCAMSSKIDTSDSRGVTSVLSTPRVSSTGSYSGPRGAVKRRRRKKIVKYTLQIVEV